jgi:hypothetical protein
VPNGQELAHLLDELELLAGQQGGDRRAEIERRVMELLAEGTPHDERRQHVRVPCNLWVKVRCGDDARPGVVMDVSGGGLYVSTLVDADRGDAVKIEGEHLLDATDDGFTLSGTVSWVGNKTDALGFGVELDVLDPAAAEPLRRFVLQVLRRVVQQHASLAVDQVDPDA